MGLPSNRVTHLRELADVQVSATEPATRDNGDALQDDDLWLDLSVAPRVWRTYDSSVPGYVAMGGGSGSSGVRVEKAGTVIGTRGGVNFIPGANVTLTVTDDAANDEVDITIAATGGGGFITPTDIADLEVWLDADAIAGLADTDPVSSWTDETGNGHDAAQATASKQPTFRTDVANGLPMVRFDGGDVLKIPDAAAYKTADMTLFVVGSITTANTVLIAYPHAATHTDPYFRWVIYRTGDQIHSRWNGTSLGNTPLPWYEPHYIWELGDARLRRAGTVEQAGTDAPMTYPNAVGIHLGANAADSEGLVGDIGEVLLYTRSLTPAERAKVRAYLSNKWALPAMNMAT